jgi:hypothetical protein
MVMGRNKYTIVTCGGYIWGIGAKFRRELDLAGSKKPLECCTLSVCFVGNCLSALYITSPLYIAYL